MAPYYDNPGQVNDEAINIAGNKTFQVIQLADSEGNVINPASGEIVLNGDVIIGTEIEIANDIGNPVPVINGFALPVFDEFELDDPDKPVEIVYSYQENVVATVTLRYADEGEGGLIGGSIAYPEV